MAWGEGFKEDGANCLSKGKTILKSLQIEAVISPTKRRRRRQAIP